MFRTLMQKFIIMNYTPLHKIAIFGVPRSGTSWLGQLFNSHPDVAFRFQPLFSYSHKGAISEESTYNDLQKFWHDIYYTEDQFVLLKDSDIHKNYPVFPNKANQPEFLVFKEVRYLHLIESLLKKDPELKVVGIVRNPCSVMLSWKKAPREFKPGWSFAKEWRSARLKNQGRKEEFFGFNKWKEVADSFIDFNEKYPNFFLLKYAELHSNPLNITKETFAWSGLNLNEQTVKFIEQSTTTHSDDENAVFRSKHKDDKWKTELDPQIIEEIYFELRGTRLEQFLD